MTTSWRSKWVGGSGSGGGGSSKPQSSSLPEFRSTAALLEVK